MHLRVLATVSFLLLLASLTVFAQKPELVVQTGHSQSLSSVAFSPDGKVIASGSSDNTIKLGDVATGKQLRSLAGNTDGVRSVAFSRNGQVIASGDGDSTIKLWEVATGKQLRSLAGLAGSVGSVAFNVDGKVIATDLDLAIAYESDALKHSYLTYALIEEGLKAKTNEADTNKDGQVDLREWFDYATQEVPRLRAQKIEQSVKHQGRGPRTATTSSRATRALRMSRDRATPRPSSPARRDPRFRGTTGRTGTRTSPGTPTRTISSRARNNPPPGLTFTSPGAPQRRGP